MKCPHCKKKIDFIRQGTDLLRMWAGDNAPEAIGFILCGSCHKYAFGLDLCSGKDIVTKEIKVPAFEKVPGVKTAVIPHRKKHGKAKTRQS